MSVAGIGGGGWAAYAARGLNKVGVASEGEGDIAAVRKDGLTTFAKNAKKEAWLEKLRQWREEAMKAMGLTEEKLASMSSEARSNALRQIEEAVQRKIKEAMELAREEGKRKGGENGQMSVPQFIDFSV
ncbi:hypothetical protein [Caulobacter segnis]|uniref:hypothetical protein n=1 Tax=Caulobacter segnis TaxID=88688 RepID=UPI002861DEA9|nr:hypothetical protein [Caulobacter segnis]MDR6627585.1 flagellar biosynthesis/type III secretory pathway protein FliH [Caulobacter segnis]